MNRFIIRTFHVSISALLTALPWSQAQQPESSEFSDQFLFSDRIFSEDRRFALGGGAEGVETLVPPLGAVPPLGRKNHQIDVPDCVSDLLLGRYDEAIAKADGILGRHPGHLPALQVKAAALVKSGEIDQGIRVLEEALTHASEPATILRKLADTCMTLEKYPEARKYVDRMLEIDPDDDLAHQRLGYLAEQAGAFDEAIAGYEAGLENVPEHYVGVNVNLGRLYNQAGRFQDTLERLQERVTPATRIPEAHNVLAAAFLGLGDRQKALEHLRTACDQAPQNDGYVRGLAMVYHRSGEVQEARRILEEAVVRPSCSAETVALLGDLELSEGNVDEAIESYGEAAKWSENPALYERRIGAAYLASSRYEEAIAAFERVTKSAASGVESFVGLAQAYAALSRGKLAEATLLEACRRHPDDPRSYYHLAIFCERAGKVEQASEQLTRALELSPNDPALLRAIASLQARLGNAKKALEYAQKAVETGAADPENKVFLAVLTNQFGDSEKAGSLYREVLADQPGNLAARHNLASILSGQGDHRAAVKEVDVILEAFSEVPTSAKTSLASILHAAGEAPRAVALYEEVLAKAPDDIVTINNLALLVLESGKPDRALELAKSAAEAAVGKDPETLAKTLDTLGWVRYKRGEIEEAVTMLEAASALQSADPEISYHLAKAYLESAREGEAYALLKRAVQTREKLPEYREAVELLNRMEGGR
jgi:tetratricopeptide (TPR) repeat protein